MAESKKILPSVAVDVAFGDDVAGANVYSPDNAIRATLTPVGDLPRSTEMALAQDGGAGFIYAAIDGGVSDGREFQLKFFARDTVPGADQTLFELLRAYYDPDTYFAGSQFAAWADANNLIGGGKRALKVMLAAKEQGDAPSTYTQTIRAIVTDFTWEQQGEALSWTVTMKSLGDGVWA